MTIFKSNKVIKQQGSPRRYATTRFPRKSDFESPDDVKMISSNTTRLDLLAHSYYGNVDDWKIIAWFSGLASPYVQAGVELTIPIRIDEIRRAVIEINK